MGLKRLRSAVSVSLPQKFFAMRKLTYNNSFTFLSFLYLALPLQNLVPDPPILILILYLCLFIGLITLYSVLCGLLTRYLSYADDTKFFYIVQCNEFEDI